MINALVISLFVVIFSVEYLVRERELLHAYFVLLPELLSAIAMVIVLMRLMAGVRISIDGRYVLFIALLSFAMVFGFVVQDVPTGAIVAGIRAHLKFIPFFLLPLVYRFTPGQLKLQLIVLLALLVMQTPLAFYQRFVEFAHLMDTGDPVKGTATTSSALSMLMICGIAVLVSLYLRGKIRIPLLLGLMGVLFLPTTINETKATLLLLPVALVLPALGMPRGNRAWRRLLPIGAAGAVAAVAFVFTYNALIQHREYGQPIGDYFSGDSFERYLYTRGAEEELNYIGRFDSIEIALERNAGDPLRLAFGLGAGNVSTSFLRQFDGEYAAYFERFGVDMTQVTNLLWQIGLVGLGAYLMLYYFLIRDSWALSKREEDAAILGQIWFAVMAVMTFALIYKSVFAMNEIGYPFWFYSGVVVGEFVTGRGRSRLDTAPARRPPAAWVLAQRVRTPASRGTVAPIEARESEALS